MSLRILIIDDSKVVRIFIIGALRRVRPDCSWMEASADNALEVLANELVDVALIDFNMPGTDGLKLATTIRQTHPHMPIAIVSANI